MLKITHLKIRFSVIVNSSQQNNRFTKFAQVTKQFNVLSKITHLTVIFSTFSMKMRNVVKIILYYLLDFLNGNIEFDLKSNFQLLR